MFGGIDPSKMKAMMKQMGIKQDEVEAIRVIIETSDGKTIIEPANVQKITMQGQVSWQVTGDAREETGISDADVKLVMEKTGKNEQEARKALEANNGDIAEALLSLDA